MKKLSRIIMLLVLAFLMLIPMACACTINPEKGDNGIVYKYDMATASYVVVDYKANSDDVKIIGNKILVEKVVIPETFNGKPVTKIEVGAFRQKYTENRHDYAEYRDFTNGKINEETLRDEKNNVDIAYYAKIQESTHLFIADFVVLDERINAENARMVIDGKVYAITLIDNPMGMGKQLEIYLKYTGGQ